MAPRPLLSHGPLLRDHDCAGSGDSKDHKPPLLDNEKLRLQEFGNRFCPGSHFLAIRANRQIDHIFGELYQIPQEFRHDYYKIKVLELLLFLSMIDPGTGTRPGPCHQKSDRHYPAGTAPDHAEPPGKYNDRSAGKGILHQLNLLEKQLQAGLQHDHQGLLKKGAHGAGLRPASDHRRAPWPISRLPWAIRIRVSFPPRSRQSMG